MPQNPLQYAVGKNTSNVATPLNTDATGTLATAKTAAGVAAVPAQDASSNLRVNPNPQNSSLGITAATVVKAAPGRLGMASLIIGGSTAGAIHDCLTTSACNTTNQIAVLPPLTTAQIGVLQIQSIAKVGIVVMPGTGQTVTVTYE